MPQGGLNKPHPPSSIPLASHPRLHSPRWAHVLSPGTFASPSNHCNITRVQSPSIQSPACLRPERSTRKVPYRQMASLRADHPSFRIGCDPHEPGSGLASDGFALHFSGSLVNASRIFHPKSLQRSHPRDVRGFIARPAYPSYKKTVQSSAAPMRRCHSVIVYSYPISTSLSALWKSRTLMSPTGG